MNIRCISRGLALVMAVAALLGWGAAALGAGGYVEVPSVAHLEPAQACAQLEAAGFKCKKGPGGPYPPDHRQWLVGRVSGHWPRAGTRHQKGSIVTLYTYAQRWVTVPDLKGHRAGQAAKKLTDIGLLSSETWKRTGDSSQDQMVYETWPAQGARLKPNGRVTLYAYRFEGARVPRLAGLSETAARARLKDSGLGCLVSDKHNITSDEPAKWYTVAVQRPPAGSTLGRGKKVTVFLYKKAEVTIPNNIVGMTYPTARRALRPGCLELSVVHEDTSDPGQDRLVKAASPGPGSRLPCGSRVTLRVYNYRK